jgi:hypothetical protein
MHGRCTPCKVDLEVPRYQATPPTMNQRTAGVMGIWNDCWYCACPRCGARVYLNIKSRHTEEP